MKNKIKSLFAAFLFASVLMVLVSCSKPESVKVDVVKPQIKEVEIRSKIEISVKPTDKITVVSEVYGKVDSVKVEIGTIVNSGDILVSLDSSDAKKEISYLQSEHDRMLEEVVGIENSLDLMDEDADEMIDVLEPEGETVSRSELTSRLSESQKNLDEVRSNLDRLKRQVRNSNVYSPIQGVITKMEAGKGDVVMSMDGIVEISDFSKLELRTKVRREDISGLYVGDTISLEIDGKGELESKIKSMKMIDRKNNIYLVKLESDNYDRKIKSYGDIGASIVTGKKQVLYLPKEAVVEDDGGKYVFCVKDSKAIKKYLEVSELVDGIEIKSSVEMTEEIVFNPDKSFMDGMEVEVAHVKDER